MGGKGGLGKSTPLSLSLCPPRGTPNPFFVPPDDTYVDIVGVVDTGCRRYYRTVKHERTSNKRENKDKLFRLIKWQYHEKSGVIQAHIGMDRFKAQEPRQQLLYFYDTPSKCVNFLKLLIQWA